MASTINATSTGSGGLITTGNSVNQLELQTGDTTRLVIDSSGNVTIQGQGDLRLADSDSSHYVALQAPGTVASNVTFTLPSADGTNGQVLQTNGSGTLSFATPSGGSWIYLSTVTASNSATVDMETTLDSTYDTYAIICSNLVAQNAGYTLAVRFKESGTYQTADYSYYRINGVTNNAVNNTNTDSADGIYITAGQASAADKPGNFVLYLFRPSSTTVRKNVQWTGGGGESSSANYIYTVSGAGNRNSTTAVTGIRFLFGLGNITSGTFRLYGIKNS